MNFPVPCLCQLCSATLGRPANICRDCEEHLPWLAPGCPICALPMPELGPGNRICHQCRRQPPDFDRCLALFDYLNPIDGLISRFKYHQDLAAGRLLRKLLHSNMLRFHREMQLGLPQRLIPIPLHHTRLRQRGYNQSLELCRGIQAAAGIAVDRQSCRRVCPTSAQQGLDRRGREQNMAGAFSIHKPDRLRGLQHVAIVDDVVTTGATCNELARLLRHNGVTQVDVWCLARVPTEEEIAT